MEEVIILTGKPFSAPQCHRRCQPSQRCVQDHHYHYILISFKNKIALINRWIHHHNQQHNHCHLVVHHHNELS